MKEGKELSKQQYLENVWFCPVGLTNDGEYLHIWSVSLYPELNSDLGYEIFIIFFLFLLEEQITYWQSLLILQPVFITHIQKQEDQCFERGDGSQFHFDPFVNVIIFFFCVQYFPHYDFQNKYPPESYSIRSKQNLCINPYEEQFKPLKLLNSVISVELAIYTGLPKG